MKNVLLKHTVGIFLLCFISYTVIAQCTYFSNVFTSSSANHCFATKNDGTIWSWGSNSGGQLANGGSGNLGLQQIGAATNWKMISAGNSHTVAVKNDGTLWACGSNGWGELGNGSFDAALTFIQIGSANDWAYVSAGNSYTLAIKTNGTLWGWGINSNGSLGTANNTEAFYNTPQQLGNANNWIKVEASSGSSSYGLRSNFTIWAWGNNNNGQLGLGNTTTATAPTQIGSGTNWKNISGGGSHAMAIKQDGTLWAWGRNDIGQLGVGNTTQQNSPVQVGVATDWEQVSLGKLHCIALKANGTLWAWGHNAYGQLGDATSTNRTAPKQIGTAQNWTIIAAGGEHSTALKTNGTAWAWGRNNTSQVSYGGSSNYTSPFQVGATPMFTGLAPDGTSVNRVINGNTIFHDNCKYIATVTTTIISGVTGDVNARVWVKADQPERFVKRHYQIIPNELPNSVRGVVTLYFTDAEFNSFNTQSPAPALLLPVSTQPTATQTANKANLRVEKLPGTTSDGSGLPSTYSGVASTIDVDDDKIIWNATDERWEVTFTIEGFGGLFVKTSTTPLPLDFVAFTAAHCNTDVCLNWRTANEVNVSHFDMERSTDGSSFQNIGTVPVGNKAYSFTDNQPDWRRGIAYYRIKQTDKDGRYSYSKVASLKNKVDEVLVYPRAFTQQFKVVNNGAPTMLQLRDMHGRMLLQRPLATGTNTIDAMQLSSGTYYFTIPGSTGSVVSGKIIKQ